MQEKYRVQKSGIAGKGVFATVPIRKGELVRQFTGMSMNLGEMLRLVDEGKEAGSDPLGVDNDEYLDLDETSRTFNHSCDPNCYLRGRSDLVAMRDIAVGEELTYDYSTTMDDDEAKIVAHGHELWTCPCTCGSKNCRGIIDQFRTLPEARRCFYLHNRFTPDFIRKNFARERIVC